MKFKIHLMSYVVLFIILALSFVTIDNNTVIADTNSTNTTNVTQLINTTLSIWDSGLTYVNSSVLLYANYSYENGTISGTQVCSYDNIFMHFNLSNGLYYIDTEFELSGNFTYEINCVKDNYEELTESGMIEILPLNITLNETVTNTTNVTIIDDDSDGYESEIDCNDHNPNINPGMNEIFYNGIDDDCNTNTVDYLVFNVTTSKGVYSHSETVDITIIAQNESDTYITVNTPTNVSYVYIFSNGTYPITHEFSLTGLSGTYTVDTVNYYDVFTKTDSLEFRIDDTMQVTITSDKTVVMQDEKVHLESSIVGNIGDYNLIWNMGDDTEYYDEMIEHSYSNPGVYNVVLIGTDTGGNNILETYQITVIPRFYLNVKVIDNVTSELIQNSTVELNGLDRIVNSTGQARYNITNTTYDLEAHAEGYYSFDGGIKVNQSLDYTIKLNRDYTKTIPNVTLISPLNNTNINEVTLKFKLTDNTDNASCIIYTSEGDGWWIDSKTLDELESDVIYTVNLELESTEYFWKVHCEDVDSNVGISKTNYFIIGNGVNGGVSTTSADEESPDETYNVVQNVYDVIPDFDTYSPDEKKIVDYLNMDVLLKDARRKLDMANRDLYNLRKEPDTQSILDKREEIYKRIDDIKDKTPISVSVVEKAEFVKYLNNEEYEILFDKYLDLRRIELKTYEKKKLLEQNIELQKKLTIETVAYNVDIKYISDRDEEITLIVRKVTIDENDIMFVEELPKSLVESTNDIEFISKPVNILDEDPMFEISLTGLNEVVYYKKIQ